MTAMMAFFLVMWLSAQDKEILIATSRYFQSPFSSPFENKSGFMDNEANRPAQKSGSAEGQIDPGGGHASTARSIDLQFLNSVAKDVYRLLNLDSDLADKPIDVQVTSDGLRIMLYDRARQPFFEERTARFTPWGDFVMQSLAWMIDRNAFYVVIEGHTRAGLDLPDPDYTSWELSADRANSARRALVRYAVAPELVERVTGYADTRPVPMMDPTAETNQRVTLSLRVGRRDEKKPAQKKPAADAPAADRPATAAVPGKAAPSSPAAQATPAAHTPPAHP